MRFLKGKLYADNTAPNFPVMVLGSSGRTGLYWALLGCIGLYWAAHALGCAGLQLGCTGLYWALLDFTELYWAVMVLSEWSGLSRWAGWSRWSSRAAQKSKSCQNHLQLSL